MEVHPKDGSHLLFDQSLLIKVRDCTQTHEYPKSLPCTVGEVSKRLIHVMEEAIRATNGLFVNMYWSLTDFGNYTSNAIFTFMRLYAVSDFNQ